MSSAIEATIWTYQGTRSDGDQAGVEKGAIEVDVNVFAKSKGVRASERKTFGSG